MDKRRGNRFGTLISKGDGKPWLGKWVSHGKVYYKSTGETDKKKALKALEVMTRPYREDDESAIIENLELMLKRLKTNTTTAKKLEVKDLWDVFEKTLWQADIEDSTSKIYEVGVRHLQTWLEFKVTDIAKVDVKMAEAYLKELSDIIGNATFNTRLSLFKRIWHNLPAEYGIDKTIWDGFKKKKGSTKSARRALTIDELKSIVSHAPTKDIKLLLLIGAYTGLRIGDCANLKWSDVDFEAKTLTVLPQKTKKHMDAPIVIPLHPSLYDALLEAKSGTVHVSEANHEMYKSGKLNAKVVSLFKKCGIETSRIVDGKNKLISGFHSLRHTFVSMAINGGMSPLLIQRIVGHSTVNMTDHYFHDNMTKAAEGISQLPDVA